MTGSRPKRLSIEDFRPGSLDEIVGQSVAIVRLRRILDGVRNGIVVPPNLLLHGPPGVGKTAAARAFGRAALGVHYDADFNELKAFDDRSPRAIYGMIESSRAPPSGGGQFRIIFIDEVDALSSDAQLNLRPAMEREGGWSVYSTSSRATT